MVRHAVIYNPRSLGDNDATEGRNTTVLKIKQKSELVQQKLQGRCKPVAS